MRYKNCHTSDVILDSDRKGLSAQYGIENIVWERVVTHAGLDGVTEETACNRVVLRDIQVVDADTIGINVTSGNVRARCADVLLDNVTIENAGTTGLSIALSDRVSIRKTRVVTAGTQGMWVSGVTDLPVSAGSAFPSVT